MDLYPPPSPKVLAEVTAESAAFIEIEANKAYDFALESRETLTREAHTTLQWLFAIVIGTAGFAVKLVSKHYDPKPFDLSAVWWAFLPLLTVIVLAALEAYLLIRRALQPGVVYPKGNSAQKLTGGDLPTRPDFQQRFLLAWTLTQRISWVEQSNAERGTAIREARFCVVAIPLAGTILLLVSYALFG